MILILIGCNLKECTAKFGPRCLTIIGNCQPLASFLVLSNSHKYSDHLATEYANLPPHRVVANEGRREGSFKIELLIEDVLDFEPIPLKFYDHGVLSIFLLYRKVEIEEMDRPVISNLFKRKI